jgi:hypothetical protein
VKQSLLVILIHMFDYGFLRFAKRIPDEHRVRLDPENLTKPADETRSSQSNSIKRKIVRREVGFRGGEITQVALAYFQLGRINQLGVSDPGEATV